MKNFKQIRYFLSAFLLVMLSVFGTAQQRQKTSSTTDSANTMLGKSTFAVEILKKNSITVVHNLLAIDRKEEMVEINWDYFSKSNFDPKKITVVNARTQEEIPSQVIFNGKETPHSIIFQCGLSANDTGYFYFKKQQPRNYPAKVFGRFVPERFDDFAWENDRIAFRMYGAALEGQVGNAKGIDLWGKKVPDLVIDKWYKGDDYHIDHGEGLDAYNVGMTLGAGNSAPIANNELMFPDNYSYYKILDQGPLRIVFELYYNTWMVNGMKVQQVKTISLDAGSNLNKVTDKYLFDGRDLVIAAGVTKHKDDGNDVIDSVNRFISYWDQADGKVDNGKIGVGIIVPGFEQVSLKNELGHLLAITTIAHGQHFIYYQGGAWNRSGIFPDEKSWIIYLENYSEKIKSPLEIISY